MVIVGTPQHRSVVVEVEKLAILVVFVGVIVFERCCFVCGYKPPKPSRRIMVSNHWLLRAEAR